MAIGKFRLRRELYKSHRIDAQKDIEFPGLLGAKIGGSTKVNIPGRNGYVYVRLHGNLSELVMAYNDQVSPVYGLPVLVIRDGANANRWRIKSKDFGQYENWGLSSYLPTHGSTHSYNPLNPGGDITWVYSDQFMPLAVIPSGTYGAMSVVVQEGAYHDSVKVIKFFTGACTPSLASYRPTNNQAKMLLISINNSGTFSYTEGSLFDVSITGTSVYSYVPVPPSNSLIDLAAIRLVSGTFSVGWDEIFDVRQFVR